MVDSIEDLQEGFYSVNAPVIGIPDICYVTKKADKWTASFPPERHYPNGSCAAIDERAGVGIDCVGVNPLVLEGPIDPEDYLKQHNTNLKTFVSSKLELKIRAISSI